MLDENEHSRKEDGRSLHRLLQKTEQQDATVEVDSAAFFSELPPEQAAPPPRRPQQNTPRSTAAMASTTTANRILVKSFLFFMAYCSPGLSCSSSASQRVAQASLGIRQSPRGERVTLPTLGPSGRQLRLNCWAKKRQ